jgi:RNA polymerase-binding transcription factor DksA
MKKSDSKEVKATKKATTAKPVKVAEKKVAAKKDIAKERTRFADEELEEFKEIINNKLEEARRDYQLLTEAFTNSDGQDINDTSPTYKILEEGAQVLSKEENSQLAARQLKFITALENALIRIKNKTYGVCRVTGKLISKERLRIVPHATLSMEAKLLQKK